MQSAEHHEQDSASLALSKTFDHKENNGSSPAAQRLRSARGLRGLGLSRAARDAPPPQREELADDTRATPLDQLATLAALQRPVLKVDAALLRRRARAARRATAKGDVVVHVDVSFAGALDVYAPREHASEAGLLWRERWTTDSTKVVFLQTNDQLKDMIKRLDTDGLDLSEAVANEIGDIFFENRKVLAPIVTGKKICNKARGAALTKASLHRLVNKVINHMRDTDQRKSEPAHGPVMRKLWKVLEKAGVTLSGGVGGVLAPFGVEGAYNGGHMGGEKHVLSKASSVVCKCWMITAARGKLDEKVAQCIGCTFGDGTAEANELSTLEAGNFAGAKRFGVPLRRAYADPQQARAAYVDLLDNGPVRAGTKIVVGMLGAAVMGDAVRRGIVDTTLIIADVGGVDFVKVAPDFCTKSRKMGERLAEDWDEKDRLFAERHPAIHKIHGLLVAHGLRDALAGGKPTRSHGRVRSAYDVVSPTFCSINDLPNGTSPLIKTMRVALFREKVFFGHPKTLEELNSYDPAWPITQRLEAEIGCKVKELTAAAFDPDDLVTIETGERYESTSRTVPKKRTKENERGERVLKKRRDEGKKPATCPCGNKFLSNRKPNPPRQPGIPCVNGTKAGCGRAIAQYDD